MLKHTQAEYEATVQRLSWEYLDKCTVNPPPLSNELGLAIRRMVISWIQADKPYCIGEATPTEIQLYGGIKLQKTPTGSLSVGGKRDGFSESTPIAEIGLSLVSAAQRKVEAEYATRLHAFTADVFEAWPNKPANDDANYEYYLQAHTNWVVEGGMRVAYWGRGIYASMLSKLLLKKAWELGILDKEIWGLTLRVAGLRARVEHYNRIAKNLEEVRARKAETPNLLPLLWAPVTTDPYDDEFQLRTDQLALSAAREKLMVHGLTPAGWRWLTKQNREWVARFAGTINRRGLAFTLNTLAAQQVGVLPRGIIAVGTLLQWMTDSQREQSPDTTHHPVSLARVLKATIEAVRKRKVTVASARDDIQLVLDFVRAGHPVEKGATFRSLMRRQAEWHLAMHREQINRLKEARNDLPAYAWTPLVSEVVYDEVRAVSLTTSDDLWEEGDFLEHCVGTYAAACYENRSRIFSFRDNQGSSLATLELSVYNGRWSVAQLRGRRNRAVSSKALLTLADLVLREAKRAPQLDRSQNILLREGSLPLHWGLHEAPRLAAINGDGPLDDQIPF